MRLNASNGVKAKRSGGFIILSQREFAQGQMPLRPARAEKAEKPGSSPGAAHHNKPFEGSL
jgi:hypothetical protein